MDVNRYNANIYQFYNRKSLRNHKATHPHVAMNQKELNIHPALALANAGLLSRIKSNALKIFISGLSLIGLILRHEVANIPKLLIVITGCHFLAVYGLMYHLHG